MNGLARPSLRGLVHGVVFGIGCVGMSGAFAQSSYTCRDHGGRTITSDRPSPDCVGVVRELSPTGVLRREIQPPLTYEQQRQKEADDKSRRLADEAVREKRRRDIALLAAYQSEDDIEYARRRAVADADDSIRNAQTRLADLQADKRSLAQEAEAYRNKTMPPLFRRRIDDNQALIDDEIATIKLRQTDAERINQHYDDDTRRYRELVGSAGLPQRTSRQ